MADIGQSTAKAQSFLAQADKRLATGGFKSLFEDKKDKFQDAADLYSKAANFFKLAKNLDAAGDAYAKAAECYLKYGYKHDAATALVNAANCLTKTNVEAAATNMKKAVELYLDDGRFSMAAKAQKDIAEMFEQDGKVDKAIESLLAAADLYENDKSQSNAQTCLLKVAHYSATFDHFDKAIEIFEKCAEQSMENKLLRFSVREYLLKASFCHLASGDIVGTKKALDKFNSLAYDWPGSREAKFIEELVNACENYDQDAFTAATQSFDSISRLDPWKTAILLKVKNTIKQEESDLT